MAFLNSIPWWVFAALGALTAGATNVLIKAGMKGVDSYLATAVRAILILPVVWLVAFWFSKVSAVTSWSPRNWVFLAFSALAAGLSWVCSYKAIDLAGAARAGPIDKSSLAFTMVLAWMFLGETISPRLLLAGSLVLAGAILSAFK